MHLKPGSATKARVIRSMAPRTVPFLIAGGCLWLLTQRLDGQSWPGIAQAVASLAAWQWMAAALATAGSFWALGRYDVLMHRHLRTGIAPRAASQSGAAAIALSQTIGMGVASGALVRWRLLPDLSMTKAVQISLGVALTFLLALALVIGVVALVLAPPFLPRGLGAMLVFLFLASALAAFLYPSLRFWRWHIRWPSLPALAAMAGLAALDTGLAALALWLVLPPGADPGLALLLPAYLLALAAALLTGTPAGLGPFELTLLALLPQVPPPDLLAGIVAFRLVYYALPAVLAAVRLGVPLRPGPGGRAPDMPLHHRDLAQAPRAEMAVCRQTPAHLLHNGASRLAVLRRPQTLCTLFAPLSGPLPAALITLHRAARAENRVAIAYKLSARLAAQARRAGWRVLHIADEQVIDTARFDSTGPAHRQLRRKLRHAARAGLTIARPRTLPFGDLARIDAAWQARRGPARGFSMGRYCPAYISHQAVFVAHLEGRACAFVTCHVTPQEWCLDLMRATDECPDGTMHALVTAAIAAARAAGCPRFSLAATPPQRGPVARALALWQDDSGLIRFKSSFAPRAEPLYATAPGWGALALGLADIARAITQPDSSAPQHHHEEFAFARALKT